MRSTTLEVCLKRERKWFTLFGVRVVREVFPDPPIVTLKFEGGRVQG